MTQSGPDWLLACNGCDVGGALFAANLVAGTCQGPHLPPSQSNMEAGATQQGTIELGTPPVVHLCCGPDTSRLRIIHQKSPRPGKGPYSLHLLMECAFVREKMKIAKGKKALLA